MKRFLTPLFVCFMCLFAVACSSNQSCFPLKCSADDMSCRQPLQKVSYTPIGGGDEKKLGIISYIVTAVKDAVEGSAKKIFEKIIDDSSFKKILTGMMTLFVAVYGISIALGIAQPSPLELVIRVAKMSIIYFLLGSWTNFQDIVIGFFEDMTDGLSTVFTSAIVSSAGGGTEKVNALDVFNFIDEKILGVLFSTRFAVIIGAMMTVSAVGVMVSLLLLSVVLSYLWTLVMAVQIYIMSSIARQLLYALSPIFIIFLLFAQTKTLFEGWLKQLINFSLQPVLLVGFLAFFNGIFFNYLDTMFNDGYEVCYGKREVAGQVVKLSKFVIKKINEAPPPADKPIPLAEVLDMFTLFVVIMLGTIMVKMNQWAVQAAAQLSEGGITFTQTMQANGQMASNIVKGAGDAARSTFKKPPAG